MQVFKKILILLTIIISTANYAFEYKKGITTANKVNVRVKPSTETISYTAVVTLLKNSTVIIADEKDGWYKILAPKKSSSWVHKNFVSEKNRILKDVNLRSGPGVAFNAYGVVKKGTTVIRNKKIRGDWYSIQPPKGTVAWISKEFVELVKIKKEEVKKEEKIEILISEENVENTLTVGIAQKALENLTKTDIPLDEATLTDIKTGKNIVLPFIEGMAFEAAYEGNIVALNPGAIYVTHCLTAQVRGKSYPICFLHSNRLDISKWERKKVLVKGIQKAVKGWKRPVLEVAEIINIEEAKENKLDSISKRKEEKIAVPKEKEDIIPPKELNKKDSSKVKE